MNKIILKQAKKKEEAIENKSVRITKSQIQERLMNHFKFHIGEEEKTTADEIFQIVIGFSPYDVDSFSRFYWWNSIEQVIRQLRREDKCFVIKKHGYYFVLQTEEEAGYYKELCDKAIKRMENAKIRADDWVENEKFSTMGIIIPERENPLISTGKLVEQNINTAKRKIVKLYKGEK